MADKKISQLTDGTSLQSGDFVVVARSGNNFKVDPTQFGSDISLGDNVKATFGDSSDLQIYHDGSDSYINDVGAGNLRIRSNGATGVIIDDGTFILATFDASSNNVKLNHNGNQKLATTATGIDVTGTVTADGLTVSNGTNTTAIPTTSDRISFTAVTSYIQASGAFFAQAAGDIVLSATGAEVMRLKSGNVGIGSATINTFYDTAVNVYGSGNSVIQFQTSNTGTASGDGFAVGVLNGAATDAYIWNRESSNLLFGTGGGEKMRIDSSGNLLVSDTTANPSGDNVDSGIALHNAGLVRASTNNAAAALDLNVKGREGVIAEFRKDGTSVGSIGVVTSDNLYIQGNSSHVGLAFGASALIPFKNGAYTDNVSDIGGSTNRFKDLYLSGGVVLDEANLTSEAASTSGTSATQIASFAVATYGGAKFVVTAHDTVAGERYIVEILVTHDGTTAFSTEYAQVATSTALATYTVDINSGNVRLLATAASSNATNYRVVETLIDA